MYSPVMGIYRCGVTAQQQTSFQFSVPVRSPPRSPSSSRFHLVTCPTSDFLLPIPAAAAAGRQAPARGREVSPQRAAAVQEPGPERRGHDEGGAGPPGGLQGQGSACKRPCFACLWSPMCVVVGIRLCLWGYTCKFRYVWYVVRTSREGGSVSHARWCSRRAGGWSREGGCRFRVSAGGRDGLVGCGTAPHRVGWYRGFVCGLRDSPPSQLSTKTVRNRCIFFRTYLAL